MTILNKEQSEITKFNIDTIKQELEIEFERLLNSNAIYPDIDGYYPLSTLYKVALENLANSYGVTDKKAYKNLQKL